MINRTLIALATIFIFTLCTYGQKTGLNFNAFTTFFGFRGNGTTKTSYINGYQLKSDASTNNVFGQTGDFSYSFELQGQQITKQKFIYGLSIGYEVDNSKVSIDSVIINDANKPRYPATGKTVLKNSFITFNPFLGHRFITSKISLDFSIGLDLAFCEKSEEKIAINVFQDHPKFTNDRDKPAVDYRPRIQLKAQFKRLGIIAGYSIGLTNFSEKPNTKAYTKSLRLGLAFRIK